MNTDQAPSAADRGSELSEGLAGRWRTRPIYERTKPCQPMRVDLGPLRGSETDGALHEALLRRHRRATAVVL